MAYILRQKGSNTNILCHYFECDEESDLLKIDVTASPMGSRCYIINSGKTYALNSAKEWKLVPYGSSNTGDNIDVVYDGGEETNGRNL